MFHKNTLLSVRFSISSGATLTTMFNFLYLGKVIPSLFALIKFCIKRYMQQYLTQSFDRCGVFYHEKPSAASMAEHSVEMKDSRSTYLFSNAHVSSTFCFVGT